MKAVAAPLAPVRAPSECSSWLAREELTRLAVLAYEMARTGCEPPPGHRFMEDGEPWSDRPTFADGLLDNLMLLVGEYALSVGVQAPAHYDPERLALLRSDFRASLQRADLVEGVA